MINKKSHFFYNSIIHDVIKEISDINFQKRIWIRGEGPECSSFGEVVNNFFDYYEALDNIHLNYKEYNLTKQQYLKLDALYKKFDEYFDISPENEDEVIQDPRWHEIVAFAKDVYADLSKNPKLDMQD